MLDFLLGLLELFELPSPKVKIRGGYRKLAKLRFYKMYVHDILLGCFIVLWAAGLVILLQNLYCEQWDSKPGIISVSFTMKSEPAHKNILR